MKLQRFLSRSAGIAALAGALMLPSTVRAQTFTGGYVPGCGPATGCSLGRFTLTAGASPLALSNVTLTFLTSGWVFLPALGGTGTFSAQDDISPFGGFTTVAPGGASVFLDVVNTGDPQNPGFPFTLGAFSAGFFDVDVAETGATSTPMQFRYAGTLDDGSTIGGVGGVSTVTPEPATLALVASGLAVLVLASARRRRVS